MHKLIWLGKLWVIKNPEPMLVVFLGTWLHLSYLPNVDFLKLLALACIVDLIVGIRRSWKSGKFTKLSLIKKTFDKMTQYGGFIAVGTIVVNISIGENNILKYHAVVDAAYMSMILVEVVSICKSLVAINPNSAMVNVILPFMKILRVKMPAAAEKKGEDTIEAPVEKKEL